MNKWAFVLFMFWLGTSGGAFSNVIREGEIIYGNVLPDWGKVCVASEVRGGPDEIYAVRYSVVVGERVRLHDSSLPDGTWVSIGAAQWMPLKNLC